MSKFNKNKSMNYILGLTLASAIVIMSGCGGGGGSKKSVDVSGVTEVKLKKSLKDGLTKGLDSNVETLSSTFETVNNSFTNNSTPKYLAGVSTSNNAVGGLNSATDSIVDQFNLLIDNSTSTNSGNVYSFDPDENTICADPSISNNDPQKEADCVSVLSQITFISTVSAVDSNNNVTAADTVFKYGTHPFSKLGFTGNSAYYEAVLSGVSHLLAGLNTVANQNNQIDIPDSMSGSLRLASSAQTATSGTLTLSVPAAISITDASPQTAINIGATSSLFSVTANSTANTMAVNINVNALDVLTTNEENPSDLFPQQLLINTLSGQAVVSNNGNTITLTGITATGIELKIDNSQALTASLAPLNATITSGTQNVTTLNTALNLDLTMTNIRGFIDDSSTASSSDNITLTLDSPASTVLTEVANTDLVKVTGGTVALNLNKTNTTPININAQAGECINTDKDNLGVVTANCP